MEPIENEIITKISFNTEALDKSQEKADKLAATLQEIKTLKKETRPIIPADIVDVFKAYVKEQVEYYTGTEITSDVSREIRTNIQFLSEILRLTEE